MASEEDLRAADEFIQKHAVEAAVFAVVDFEATRHAIATALTAARAEQREVDAGICDAGAMLASEPMGAPEIKRVLESAAAAIRAGKE